MPITKGFLGGSDPLVQDQGDGTHVPIVKIYGGETVATPTLLVATGVSRTGAFTIPANAQSVTITCLTGTITIGTATLQSGDAVTFTAPSGAKLAAISVTGAGGWNYFEVR